MPYHGGKIFYGKRFMEKGIGPIRMVTCHDLTLDVTAGQDYRRSLRHRGDNLQWDAVRVVHIHEPHLYIACF
jgi:hypothetical protein